MIDILKSLIRQFVPFAQERLGFAEPPRLFLRQDTENANNPLGKTAYYDPDQKSITVYISGRHPKDVLRSLGHELVHHKQNCDGKFDNLGDGDMGEGYAQTNPQLRAMEFEANSRGSMALRDFEDRLKKENTTYYEHLQKGEKQMSTKDWKNKEISTLLSEAWGFKFNSLQEFDEFEGAGEIQEEAEVSEDAEVQEEAVEEPADAKGQKELEEGAEEASAETLEEEEIEEAVDTESIEPQEDVVGDVEISEDTLSEAVQDLLEKNNGRYSEEQVRTALKQAITIIKERRKMGRKSKN
jgi:hypothetical protein